jgi:hypothetical protein
MAGLSPNPITWPLPWPYRVAIWALFIGGQAAWRVYEDMADGQDELAPEAFPHFRRCQVQIVRQTPAGTQEDRATCTFDLLKYDENGPVSNWTEQDYINAEGRINAFFQNTASLMPSSHSHVQNRWYRQRFAPIGSGRTYLPEGKPARVSAAVANGTAGASSPYQLAATVTERTAMPKHWGRFYFPFSAQKLDSTGRISLIDRNLLMNQYQSCVSNLLTHNLAMVVPVTQVDKQPVRGLLGLSHVQVDDIPDVQRRRRPKQAAARSILPA